MCPLCNGEMIDLVTVLYNCKYKFDGIKKIKGKKEKYVEEGET
jgi:hypothetical protein